MLTPSNWLFLATNLVRNEQGEMEVRVGLDEIQRGYEAIIGKPDGDRAFEGPTLVLKGADSHYVADDMLPALRRSTATGKSSNT